MTECERIVAKGVMPQDFLKQEVRCEFLVTEERKKIWTVEMDLLSEFDRVCKKHGLRYFMIGGSILGAVRHKGFIPWDDDIDVGLWRTDYDKLMALSAEFSDPYFLQRPGVDDGYFYTFAKLRNSRTTCICKQFAYQNFNQGIFLDIFPMDYVSPEKYAGVYETVKKLGYDVSTAMRMSNPNLDEANRNRVARYPGGNPLEMLRRVDELVADCDDGTHQFCATATETVYALPRKIFPAHAFEETVSAEFESRQVPIPCAWDEVLKINFSDYMKLPPVEKRGDWHAYYLFDADKPYAQSLARFRAGEVV